MKLRCKNGDIAIVIYETPQCAANLGRIVEVSGPIQVNRELELPCWLIKPVRATPYAVEHGSKVLCEIIDWSSRIEIPDAWLLPLRASDDFSEVARRTEPTADASDQATLPAKVQVSVTSMSYRPPSYFGSGDLQTELLGRVKGVMRRTALKDILDQGRLADIPDVLTKTALDDVEREMSGMLHPMFMGGEYLPTVVEDEVEIARICIKSTTYDVTSVYARRSGRRIHYRVVDEYGGDTLSGMNTRTSLQPLTMGQLIKFFLGAWDLHLCLERNFEDDVGAMMGFFRGESEYYSCFDASLRTLVATRFTGRGDSA